jgi:hypothetical protein
VAEIHHQCRLWIGPGLDLDSDRIAQGRVAAIGGQCAQARTSVPSSETEDHDVFVLFGAGQGSFEPVDSGFRGCGMKRVKQGLIWEYCSRMRRGRFRRNETIPAARETIRLVPSRIRMVRNGADEGRTVSQTPRRDSRSSDSDSSAVVRPSWRGGFGGDERDTPAFRGCRKGGDRSGKTAANNGDIVIEPASVSSPSIHHWRLPRHHNLLYIAPGTNSMG